MFNKFSEETKRVIALSKKEMFELKHPYFGSEHIMLGILKGENHISNILKKYNITYKKYKNTLINMIGSGTDETKWVLYTPLVKEIFERAIDISDDNNTNVTIENLFIALIEIGDGIATRVLKKMNLNIDKLYTEILFKLPKIDTKKKTILDDIGIELTTDNMVKSFDPVMGREKEIEHIIEILIRKNKSNPLLVGAAGVGKTAIVEEISRLIVENKVPARLKNKHIINVDMSSIVAGTKYRGEFEDKLNKIIKEAEEDDDIILFIDEVHTIVGAGGAEGAIDASNIFKPALARGRIKCIGATTLEEYKKYIEKDKALERRFKKVMIEEPSLVQIKEIIYKLKSVYENYHHVNISDSLLDLIIELSNKYIHNYKNPDKTIDILDEVCAHANVKENPKLIEYDELAKELANIIDEKNNKIMSNDFKEAYRLKQKENDIVTRINNLEFCLATNHYNKVTKKDIYDVLKSKINLPILSDDKKNIINKLQRNVINQNENIRHLVNSYFTNKNSNDCLRILFTGFTGCGKTFLSEMFSKNISNNIIKLNMNEFSESHSLSKFIGTSPGYVGYEDSNLIFDSIRDYPFSAIVIDEIEKAHPKVLNILYQIFDTNELRDSKGNIIKFNNCSFLITTNLNNTKKLGFESKNAKDNIDLDASLMNRIDEVINLNKLEKNDIEKIIAKECKSKTSDNKLVNKILLECEYEKYGAKKIKKLINKYLKIKKIKKVSKNYSKN